LNEGEQEVKRYEEDMATLRQMLDQLERAKSDMKAANRQRRAAISAQRRVPVEVWEMIFSTLCLVLHEYSFDGHRSNHDSPLLQLPAILVSQVCARWNVIAKSIPSIWSSINVDIDYPKYNNPLRIYLLNSKDCPLKLRIEGTVGCNTSRQSLDIWRDLSEYLCRSRELTMAIRFFSHSTLPPVHNLKFPVLQSFSEKSSLPNEEMWPWFWQAIYGAPRLVRLSSSYLEINPLFSQLISWEMQLLGWLRDSGTFFEVLQSCSRLKSLTLTGISRLNPQSSGISREVKLPYLQQLSIHVGAEGEDWFSAIAQSLILPSLISCRIESTESPLPTMFLTMIRRSSTSLKRLELTVKWGANHPSLMLDILQAAPELTHFKLFLGLDLLPQVAEDAVTILLSKVKEGPHNFLPKLSSISVEGWSITLSTQLAERVLETVSSRRETYHPLMEFQLVRWQRRRFTGWFVLEPRLLERMRVLEEGGVSIIIEDCIKD
ncbi:hypothetical protein L218DRAFT_968670, partial [Marasmius fiardii PR-910]